MLPQSLISTAIFPSYKIFTFKFNTQAPTTHTCIRWRSFFLCVCACVVYMGGAYCTLQKRKWLRPRGWFQFIVPFTHNTTIFVAPIDAFFSNNKRTHTHTHKAIAASHILSLLLLLFSLYAAHFFFSGETVPFTSTIVCLYRVVCLRFLFGGRL